MGRRRKLKRSTSTYIIVCALSLLVVGSVFITAYFITTKAIKKEYGYKLTNAKEEMKSNKKIIYIAKGNMPPGTVIEAEDIQEREVYDSQPQEIFMTRDDIGKTVLVNVTAGTHILGSMLAEGDISNELREMEYNVIMLNSNIVDNDIVDIRIMFPNGEDYIILSKKIVKGISLDTANCFLWLSEEEILRMASAIIDAYLFEGTKIYTTKYLEPNLQDASIVTYEPNLSTLLLIKNNPNILKTATNELSEQVRKAMENRLSDNLKLDISEIEWNLSPYNLLDDTDNTLINEEETEESNKSNVDSSDGIELPAPEDDFDSDNQDTLPQEEIVTYQDELDLEKGDIDYGP